MGCVRGVAGDVDGVVVGRTSLCVYTFAAPDVMLDSSFRMFLPPDATEEWTGALGGAFRQMHDADCEFISRVVHVQLSAVMALCCMFNLIIGGAVRSQSPEERSKSHLAMLWPGLRKCKESQLDADTYPYIHVKSHQLTSTGKLKTTAQSTSSSTSRFPNSPERVVPVWPGGGNGRKASPQVEMPPSLDPHLWEDRDNLRFLPHLVPQSNTNPPGELINPTPVCRPWGVVSVPQCGDALESLRRSTRVSRTPRQLQF